MTKRNDNPTANDAGKWSRYRRLSNFESHAVLLLTELFPPAIGGSPVLFEGVYSRIERSAVVVLTDEVASAQTPDYTPAVGLEIVYAPIRTRRWGIVDVRALTHHLRVARRVQALTCRQPTVVHCGRALPEGVAALLCRVVLRGPPFIVWTHGEDITSALTSRELTFLMKRVYQGAAAVIANSANTRYMLKEIGVPEEKIRIIYPGVDPERFHPAVDGSTVRRRFAGPDEILLLTVGRHQRRKGHDHAIEAVAMLRAELPNLRYVIVGDGDERKRLEAMVAERCLGDLVTFVGEVIAADLPAYYAACDIFLHPNRIDQGDIEGFGIVFLEAAASNKPVIGGRSGGVPEAVEENVTGLLVSGTDLQELITALRRLATSSELRSRLGTAGRARVLRSFTWQAAAQAIEELHTHVAVGSRKTPASV